MLIKNKGFLMNKYIIMALVLCLTQGLGADKKNSKKEQQVEQLVIEAEKRRVKKNPNVSLKSIKISHKKDLSDNWTGYVFDLELLVKRKTKEGIVDNKIKIKDTIFTDGKLIATELIDLKTGKEFKEKMILPLSNKYYNKKYLISGSVSSKHKIVVFSEPLCPACTGTMPQFLNIVTQHPEKFAVYYIPIPLDMHPSAKLLVKASFLAKRDGIKNVTYKEYSARFGDFFKISEQGHEKIALERFNKALGTNYIMNDVLTKSLEKELIDAIKLGNDAMVNSTPSIFFDGLIDKSRSKFRKYIK